ncbi:MAG: PQQ-binding-like beta-propeller repeat protein [Verrucomicrobia bacterium]|nr:PQQ-binding-like beta-propeller repeat protein [Verrucomicrobiota bacterium]
MWTSCITAFRQVLGSWCAGALLLSLASAADQPQWGETFSRNMVSAERGLPERFDPPTGQHLKWTARLGTETHSTPVIARGRVLIGTNNGGPRDPKHRGDRGVLMCFDEATGAFLWQLAVPKLTNSIWWDWPRAGICSTATVEGERIYMVSNRGEVLCLDLHGMTNGNQGPFLEEGRHAVPPGVPPLEMGAQDADILWALDLIRECGVRQHDSAHSAILLHEDFLYVNTSNGVDDSHRQIHAPDAPSLVVLDKHTGRLVAQDAERIGPRIFHSTWSSPSLGRVHDQTLVFFGGGDGVVYAFAALTPADLRHSNVVALARVWRFDCDPSAPKEDVHRYHSNRQESPSNIVGLPVFHRDRVYVVSQGDLWWGKHEARLTCIDATRRGDITHSGKVWSYPLRQHSMSTPSVHNGLVYVTDCGRTIHCVDAETGAGCWTHEAKGEIWASSLVADGKVYVATRRGELLVFAAGRQKRLLGELKLEGPISSSPMAANGVLYIATMKHLYAAAMP